MLQEKPYSSRGLRIKKGTACADCARRKRKCTHATSKPATAVDLPSTTTAIHHYLSGTNTALCLEFVSALRDLRLDHTWLHLVPSRLGQHEAVDSAVRAVIKSKDHVLTPNESSTIASLVGYIKAVEALRIALQSSTDALSDNILAAVALLCVCETLMRSEVFACFAHWKALSAILLARPASSQNNGLSRGILYFVRNQMFHVPCARGQISPFDDPRWYTLEPADSLSLPSCVARLKYLGNQILIRLPRLVLLMRQLRENPELSTAHKAGLLADTLADLQDDAAESNVLHRVKLIKTADTEDAQLVPFSFEFKSLGELESAVLYWKAHLFLGKIRLRLATMFPDMMLETEKTEQTMRRMGMNAIMSSDYAQSQQCDDLLALPTAWIAIWALWETERKDYRGISIERWREWIRKNLNRTIPAWHSQASEDDIDEASDLLAGGPLRGLFASA